MAPHPPLRRTVLVFGATSVLMRAVATELARRGADLVLLARDAEELARVEADLRIRTGARVLSRTFDALDFSSHPALLDSCLRGAEGEIGIVFGVGEDPRIGPPDAEASLRILETNFTAAVSVLAAAAPRLEERRAGFLCAISSVAGDRPRRANYPYAAAKAGLNAFVDGLRRRLEPSGVRVTNVKLGPTDTRMAYRARDSRLLAAPEWAARDIVRSIERGRHTVYVPGVWRLLMFGVRLLPERLFRLIRE